MKLNYILILCFCFLICSCDDDKDQPEVIPEDLSVTIDVSQSGNGNVDIDASAIGALSYLIYFGEEEDETPKMTESGSISYQYSESGTYTIEVRAYGNTENYVSESENITIEVDEIQDDGYTSPESYDGMTLAWSDDFEDSELNTNDWTFETGNGTSGWGNNELQYYKEENTALKDGYLIITAKEEDYEGYNYTSSRLITKGQQSFKYGRVDVRAKLPYGQGIWPAIWMLGESIDTEDWPACGEIDIMELVGGDSNGDNTIYGTAHWQANGDHASYEGDTTLAEGVFNDEFHVFSIVWDESSITWYLDNQQYHVIDITPDDLSEFQEEFFMILNVAVGGDWPGSPDDDTAFPQQMVVDYVRVFQED